MFTLVIGGAASGKSGYAEGLVLASPHRPRYYIATMEPLDGEARRRVEKHRGMRADKRFETVECYTNLASVHLSGRGTVLLECIGNLSANELYSPKGAGNRADAAAAIVDGVEALLSQCGDLVVVSNEVFTGGADYAGGTEDYLRLVAEVNRTLAARADRVCEVVCGLPRFYRGAAG
jgi:adenosylcobinamide kinase/adenosylcobinamide-phosphate guanylyltransferase